MLLKIVDMGVVKDQRAYFRDYCKHGIVDWRCCLYDAARMMFSKFWGASHVDSVLRYLLHALPSTEHA